jgi:spoIIIJ-associated protein
VRAPAVKEAGQAGTAASATPAREQASPLPVKKIVTPPANLEEELTLNAAKEAVVELLAHMQVNAEVTVYYGEADERQSRPPVMIDLSGQDLSILIGKKAETLSALQYITSLIVSKKVGHSVSLVVDVENYRQRRATQVRQIANRVAEQVEKTGRRQSLEPMPAFERRIVHMELRNNPNVRTESAGDDPQRKVVVYPVD